MSLKTFLDNKNSIKPFLAIAHYKVKLVFKFDESVNDDIKNNFVFGLHDMCLDMPVDTDMKEEIEVKENKGVVSFVFSDGSCFNFSGEYIINSMLWASYCIASDNQWIPQGKNKDVEVRTYNINSQKIAANILSSLKQKFSGSSDETDFLDKTVDEYSRRFIEDCPKFSSQIVTKSGAEFIQKNSGFFKLKKQIYYYDLIEELFGKEKKFEDELKAYCGLLSCNSNKYKKALQDASDACMAKFMKEPVAKLNEVIEKARLELYEKYDWSDYPERISYKLQTSKKIKNITPSLLSSIFSLVNQEYDSVAVLIIKKQFITDLCSLLNSRINSELKEVIDTLRVNFIEADDFCVINAKDYGLKIVYDSRGNVITDNLSIPDSQWEPTDIQDAQMNVKVPNNFYKVAWFAGDEVSRLGEDVRSVSMLDKDYLSVILCRDNVG